MHQDEKNEYLCVHEDTVKRLLEEMPPEEDLYDLAELFKVFGDSTRIKILYALFSAELCVGDLAQLLGMSQTAVSHQLRVSSIFAAEVMILKVDPGSYTSQTSVLRERAFKSAISSLGTLFKS